ncbi:hypothetical protein [Streptomyces kunmingensis]|uniref:hypothetical protein n=1 Tax=Streptomyces kunmingensis TaxID=68225 RepID=UPI003982EA7B
MPKAPLLFRPALGSPLHLAVLLCSFALAAYAGVRLLAGDWFGVALWVVGAALLHDLVLVPLYSAADRTVLKTLGAAGWRERAGYIRVPAALSLLLLLVWFPLISGMMDARYRSATGQSAAGFLPRWLLITAALFGGSALLLAGSVLRARRAAKRRPPAVH